ncbi:MAG TPA: tRNA 2-thiouridine(34) synthase MnmA [Candidatus Babeliales bacterium]|nr:tRNA 2-thiouridine(34) synthase MnmA [Candidatus Babeliales bacterium]
MKIALLISGGVDSSVALRLLKEQGHQITAFYLKIWLEDELSYLGTCPWQEDLSYVQAVCDQADVPLEVVSMQQEYWDHVVAYTLAEIKAGRTPNPDVWCNKRVKFGFFLDYLSKQGQSFDKIASGHYAQILEDSGTFILKQAPDPIKDQTYFLSYLTQDQLSKIIFPIGHLTKAQVRELAQQFNLPNKERKDSQGICFLGKLKFSDFIAHYMGTKQGDLIEFETGKLLGTHDGFWFYTIGQRQGLGLAGGPWYVVAKDTVNNKVFISKSYYAAEKQRDRFVVGDCNWIIKPLLKPLQVKMRHGQRMHHCFINPLDNQRFMVKLAENDQGIAPGQFAVFYDGDICIGSGVIEVAQ